MKRARVAGAAFVALILIVAAVMVGGRRAPRADTAPPAQGALRVELADGPREVALTDVSRDPAVRADSLRRAEADSSFNRSYRTLAKLLGQDVTDSSVLYSALRQAYALGSELSRITQERYLIEAAYHQYVSHDTVSLMRTLRGGIDRYPDEAARATSWLAWLHDRRGAPDSAVVYAMRYMRIGTPSEGFFEGWLPEIIEMAPPDSSSAMIALFATAYPRSPGVTDARVGRFFKLGHGDSAQIAVDRAIARVRPDDHETLSRLHFVAADVATQRGRLADWEKAFHDAIHLPVDSLAPDSVRRRRATNLNRWLLDTKWRYLVDVVHDTAAAIVVQDQSLALVPLEKYNTIRAANLFLGTGRLDRADEYLRRWEAETPDSVRARPDWSVAGTLALAKRVHGHYAEAIAVLRAIPDCELCYRGQYAANFAALGMNDSAIVYLEKGIAQNAAYGSYSNAELWERLAELYDRNGDRVKAIAAYQYVVDRWRDADPPLAPRVARARERIEALSKRGP